MRVRSKTSESGTAGARFKKIAWACRSTLGETKNVVSFRIQAGSEDVFVARPDYEGKIEHVCRRFYTFIFRTTYQFL